MIVKEAAARLTSSVKIRSSIVVVGVVSERKETEREERGEEKRKLR